LNGARVAGLAGRATVFFRRHRFYVVKYSSSQLVYDKTRIVAWHGKRERADELSRLLQIDPANIIVYDKPQKPLEITVVLGKDWAEIQRRFE